MRRLTTNNRGAAVGILAGIVFVCSLRPTPANAQMLGVDRAQIKGPLTLAQAVQTGLRENLMVRASQADVKAAGAVTGIARSQRLPQLSATTYLTYGDFGNIFNTAPNVTPVNNLAVPSQGYADQNLTLSVPVYTSGRLEQQVRAASERERAAVLDVGGVQAETALRIKDAYYRTLLAAENRKVAQARVEAAAELVKTTQALFNAGKGLESSVRRVEAEQADAQRTLTTARNSQAKALLDLKA
ncbi:MAG: outer rane efflux protein, partial [Chthonomonadales bacterium]|nr:outer rane efflux protein [Chthonomonadales bacterium]